MLSNLFNGTATKAVFAAIGAAATALQVAQADGVLTGTEVGEIVGAFLVGLGFVYSVPFIGALKAITSLAVTTAALLVTALENGNGIDGNEWYALITLVITATGTYVFPNARQSDPAL